MQHTILLVFAQPDDQSFLSALETEQRQIQASLKPATDSGIVKLVVSERSSNEDVSKRLTEQPEKVCIFHFGGHAYQAGLAAQNETIFTTGLAGLLALQPNLQLVFLNGCNTQQQVQYFIQRGIPAVLATTCSVLDGEAGYFAARFYQAISERHSIHNAFKVAVAALQQKWKKYASVGLPPVQVLRGINVTELQWTSVPWQLYIQEGAEEALNWAILYPRSLTWIPTINLATDCIGREMELTTLRGMLQESNKVMLISGLGGMGKTSLASGYIQQYLDKYDHLVWINSTEDPVSAIALNPELAINLELPITEGEKTTERLTMVLNKLRNLPGQNLLVIDDVNSQITEFSDFLPGGENWQVLVTSRLQLPDFQEMTLGVLKPKDALRLFRQFYQEDDDKQATELLLEINYHTLTIEVMAKTLSRLNGLLSISELIVILKKRELDDPRLQELVWTRHAGEERAIFFHLMKVFELAKLADSELSLMQNYAVLPPAPIDVKIIAKLLSQDALKLNRQINNLHDKGWLSKQGKGFSMHRMVQEVVKYRLPPTEVELMPLMEGIRGYLQPGRLLESEYAFSLAEWLDCLETLSKPGEEWILFAFLQAFSIENFGLARRLIEHSIQRLTTVFGEEHPYVAYRKIHYATLLSELNLLDEAERQAYSAYVIFFGNFEKADPNTDFASQTHAMILLKKGEYQKAFFYLFPIIERAKKQFESPTVITKLSDYSIARIRVGDFAEGKFVIEEILEIIEKLGIENDLMVAKLKTNLAAAWIGMRKPSQAGYCLGEAMPILIEKLPKGHSFLLHAREVKAEQLAAIGEYEAAETLYDELWEELSIYGELKPPTLLIAYAKLHQKKGEFETAEQHLRQALERFEWIGRHEQLEALHGRIILGEVLTEKGALTEAETLLIVTLNKLKDIRYGFLYIDDQLIAMCTNALGMVYFKQGRLEGARSMLGEGLALAKDKKSSVVFYNYYTLRTNLEKVNAAILSAKPWYKRLYISATKKQPSRYEL